MLFVHVSLEVVQLKTHSILNFIVTNCDVVLVNSIPLLETNLRGVCSALRGKGVRKKERLKGEKKKGRGRRGREEEEEEKKDEGKKERRRRIIRRERIRSYSTWRKGGEEKKK